MIDHVIVDGPLLEASGDGFEGTSFGVGKHRVKQGPLIPSIRKTSSRARLRSAGRLGADPASEVAMAIAAAVHGTSLLSPLIDANAGMDPDRIEVGNPFQTARLLLEK